MFSYIFVIEVFLFSVIRTEPNPDTAPSNSDYYKPQAPPYYNYYDYRSQHSTPSPYLNKRNPDSSNTYQTASVAGTYGTRTSVNQCKLHINCPSKHSFLKWKICSNGSMMDFRREKSSFFGYSRTGW